MGEVDLKSRRAANKSRAIEVLTRSNRDKSYTASIRMYADLYADYVEAQENIDEHGPIVFHPKTGAPIDNPYLQIRERSRKAMLELRVEDAALWRP